MKRYLRRLVGAIALDANAYEDVEADPGATLHAGITVVLSSIAAGLGTRGLWPGAVSVLSLATVAVLAWASWALLTFEVGSRLLPGRRTHSDVGELLRTLGFASSPGLLLALGVFPGVAAPVLGLVALWTTVATVVAVRQALDYESTGRAIAVCVLGWMLTIAIILLGGVLMPPALAATGGVPVTSAAPEESLDGKESFKLYCAPCHGRNAKGDGPVASALKTLPPDLTLLGYRNAGTFPGDQVRAYITGTERMLPSHGPAEMPVWGPTFRGFESDARTRTRIRNLVGYLETIQRRMP